MAFAPSYRIAAEFGAPGHSFDATTQRLEDGFREWRKAGFAEPDSTPPGDLGYSLRVYPAEGDTLERAFRAAGSVWQERVDESTGTDAAAVHGLDVARQIVSTMAQVERVVGKLDARILRRLLGDRLTIDEVAAREGRAGPRGSTYLLSRVRDALEQLAEAGHAKGRGRGETRNSRSDAGRNYPQGVY